MVKTNNRMASRPYKTLISIIAIFAAVLSLHFLLDSNAVEAYTQYSPAALLQPNDITSVMIRDGTITNIDIASSAAVSSTKIATSTTQDWLSHSDQNIDGVKTFAQLPLVPTDTPSSSQQVVSLSYFQAAGVNTTAGSPSPTSNAPSTASSVTLTYTGATSTWTIPSTATGSLTIVVNGAGGQSGGTGTGGAGGQSSGTIQISALGTTTLRYAVGQTGQTATRSWGGGCEGGNGFSGGSGGGGACSWISTSTVWASSTALLTAGGGGGGASGASSNGGTGGGLTGGNGQVGSTGGTQSAGGSSYNCANSASEGLGANSDQSGRAGGGGGLFGGGCGNNGGGGGSGKVSSAMSNASTSNASGAAAGNNGTITITYTIQPTIVGNNYGGQLTFATSTTSTTITFGTAFANTVGCTTLSSRNLITYGTNSKTSFTVYASGTWLAGDVLNYTCL